MPMRYKNPAEAADTMEVATLTSGGVDHEKIIVELDNGGTPAMWPGDATNGGKVQGTVTANLGTLNGAATEATLATLATSGAPITGQSLEAGGSGVLGWLSSLKKAFLDRLPTALVSGRLDVNVGAGSVTVTQATAANLNATIGNFPSDQLVHATSLPLPTGASTEATLGTLATQATLAGILTELGQKTEPADTQPVSAASLPLPSGASTEATLALIKAKTDNLDVALSTRTKPADTQIVSGTVTAEAGTGPFPVSDNGGSLTVDAPVGTPVAARLSDGAAFYKATTPTDTQPVSVASLPLPSGAATLAKQPALGVAGTASADVITIQGIASMTKLLTTPDNPANLDVALSTRLKPADTLAGVTTVGAVTEITNPLPAGTNTLGKFDQGTGGASAWKVDGSAVTQPVSAALLPLSSGAASVADGVVTITSPGTAAQLPSQACKRARLTANVGNNGTLLFGASTVAAFPEFSQRGLPLWPGDQVTFEVDNLSRLFVDGTAWGDEFSYVAIN